LIEASSRVAAVTIDDVLGAELETGRPVPTAVDGEPGGQAYGRSATPVRKTYAIVKID
jgi:hypothetical protein